MNAHEPEPVSIRDEADYRKALTTLGAENKPPAVLRMLMRVLESYRAARKMGWSRPWNKYGLTTYLSFQLSPTDDAALFALARQVLGTAASAPPEALAFVDVLLADPGALMGFVFLAEYVEEGTRYETATLSIGRKVPGAARFRDRFDVLLDAPVVGSVTGGLTRVRLFVDPYDKARKDALWSETLDAPPPSEAAQLFDTLAESSWRWAHDESKRWDHWTSAYVDYFGPRTFGVSASPFYLAADRRVA